MEHIDAKSWVQDITGAVADSRRFQQERGAEFPVTAQLIQALIDDLDIAVGKQHANAMLEGYRGLKAVLDCPKPKERVSGRFQVVKAFSREEAVKQCPWAAQAQPAGMLKYLYGKWVCFETAEDAEAYQGL